MNSRSLLLAIAGFLGIAASAAGQARSVTLEWDANPESSLAGYFVYVGNAPGSYQEQHDAGLRTSFVYTNAVPGRPYFFSVAAYTSGSQVGPRSEEVFFLSGTVTSLAATPRRDVEATRPASTGAARSTLSATLCRDAEACYRVESLARRSREREFAGASHGWASVLHRERETHSAH